MLVNHNSLISSFNQHSSKSQTIAEWANQRGLRQVPVPPKYLGWEFPEKVLRPKPHSREQLTNQSKEGGFRKIDSGIFSSSEYQQNEHLVGCSQETLDLPDSLDFPDCGNSQVGKDDFDDSCRGDDVYRQKVRVSQKDLKVCLFNLSIFKLCCLTNYLILIQPLM